MAVDGHVVRLPEVADLGRHTALFLSEDGRVVAGHAETDDGETRAVMWRCS